MFSTKRFSDAFLLLLLGLILTVCGYALGHYLGKPLLDHAKASASWPSVSGKIESSQVITHHAHRHHGKHSNRNNTYSHLVEYNYQVNQQQFTNKVVWFGDDYSSSSRTTHQNVVQRYPVGTEVKVYYDPSHPELSVLEPGAKFSSYVLYGLGWTLTVIGVLILWSGIRTAIWPF
jgi:hypothetical protein